MSDSEITHFKDPFVIIELIFLLEQALHKAVRSSQGLSSREISLKVRDGSVLDEPRHMPRALQLQNHYDTIAQLEVGKANTLWLENNVNMAQHLENEWTYQDFEYEVLSALPALIPSSKSSLK